MDSKDCSTYKLSKGSAKAKCIQKIIGSNVGIKCQDSLIDSQMQKYIDEAATLGVTNVAAQMMCANFRHQGGLSAMKRVVAKTRKPYIGAFPRAGKEAVIYLQHQSSEALAVNLDRKSVV